MKFEEALLILRHGRTVRRSYWEPDCYIYQTDTEDGPAMKLNMSGASWWWVPSTKDIFANDWEEYV